MIRRTFLGAIRLLGGLGAGFAIFMLLLAWRLSSGPISFSWATPYIEDALNSAHPKFRFQFDDTILTWAGWQRTFDLRVVNARVVGDGDAVLAAVPEISLSVSARALVRGRIAPRSIEMFGPKLRIERQADGSWELGLGTDAPRSGSLARGIVNQLLAAPDPKKPMSYLSRVVVVGGDVTLADPLMNRTWRAPATDLRLERDVDGIRGSANLDLAAEGRETTVALTGNYDAKSEKTTVAARFQPINPATFARMERSFAPLAALDVPISGVVRFVLDRNREIESAAFDVKGSEGNVQLPKPLEQSLAVQRLELQGRYAAAGESLDVDKFLVDLGPEGRLLMPGPKPHPMPVRVVDLKGRYLGKDRKIEVDDVKIDLDGPVAIAKIAVTGVGGAMTVDVDGQLRDVKMDTVKRVWPPNWGRYAYRWVTQNMSGGSVPVARAKARLTVAEDGEVAVESLEGSMDLRNATVNYLDPMPKAIKANGSAVFDRKSFTITVESGEVPGGIVVKGGTVVFTGLDAVDQYLDVDLRIDGPVPRAMELIDHEPLGFARALAIDPKATEGRAEVELKLYLLLELSLSAEKVKVSAKAKLADAALRRVVLGRDLTDGTLALAVDNAGMDVRGTGRLGGIPADIHWRRNFKPNAPFVSRYRIAARIDGAKNLRDAGIDLRPVPDDFLTGAIDAKLDFTAYADRTSRLDVAADLKDAALKLPKTGWSKEKGVPGAAKATLKIADGTVSAIPTISVSAADLSVEGKATYASTGAGLEKLEFRTVRFGRNDVSVVITQRADDGGWNAAVRGRSVDLAPVWDDIVGPEKNSVGKDFSSRLRLGLVLAVDRIWLGPDRGVESIAGTFRHDGERWRTITIKGKVGDGKLFDLDLRPVEGGNRSLAIRANDAGALLKEMDFYDTMVGGRLEIVGTYHDHEAGEPLKGQVRIRDYRIIDAPALARILSVLALTGILDELRGEGLGFSQLDLKFTMTDGLLSIDDGKAYGASLGFTATGKVYTEAKAVDVQGTVVPAYAINSALGHIPLLGSLFTGGEKGGGVFAATYTMTGQRENPKVTVNPLTALAPGFLRNLFGIFGGNKQGAEVPDAKEPRPKQP